jgi:cysteine desulfurase family protein (TIGR01976 family)
MKRMPDLDAIRAAFPSLAEEDHGKPRLYFDNPAGTQVPAKVSQRMADCLLHANANIGGYFETSKRAGEVANGARRAVQDFLNAPSSDEIIFGQNMTSLTFHLSRSFGRFLKAGDEIVLSRMDHDANVQPWLLLARDHGLKVRWLPFNVETYEFELDDLEALLTDRTRLVCVGGASNLTGTINDIEGICQLARDAGALTYIDAVQSAPHMVTDVQQLGCDMLVCSAYKFFGPHQGLLWGKRAVLEQLEAYRVRPAPAELPWSFEPGTQSHEGMAGTAAAIDYLASLAGDGTVGDRRERLKSAMSSVLEYEKTLSRRLIEGLQEIPGVTVRGVTSPDATGRRVPTVSFTHATCRPDSIARALGEQNIFVWSGHNYALEAAKAMGIDSTGGAVRIGAVHYNTLSEIDRLLQALTELLD